MLICLVGAKAVTGFNCPEVWAGKSIMQLAIVFEFQIRIIIADTLSRVNIFESPVTGSV